MEQIATNRQAVPRYEFMENVLAARVFNGYETAVTLAGVVASNATAEGFAPGAQRTCVVAHVLVNVHSMLSLQGNLT